MDLPKMHKWSAFLFFLPSSLAFAYFIFYLTQFTPSYAKSPSSNNTAPVQIVPAQPETIVLYKGKTQTNGQFELTYQGWDSGSLVIDITLLGLNPDYAYRRKIPKRAAKNGFRLAQKEYQLVSVNRDELKIIRSK